MLAASCIIPNKHMPYCVYTLPYIQSGQDPSEVHRHPRIHRQPVISPIHVPGLRPM